MINISKPIIGEEEKQAVLDVLSSGLLAQGPYVARFEKEFAEYCGVSFAIATNSGTASLHTSLYSLNLEKGDEVITTPFTFVASANAILMAGYIPVFVDIDPKTYNIDPKEVSKAITNRTKAILAVDLYGQLADYESLNKIAKENNLFLIQDAAQSVGAKLGKHMSGNLADIASFSFYATKNVMSGEGGIITTNNKMFSDKSRQFRHHGQSPDKKYDYLDLGYNYRMSEIQAALAVTQIKRLPFIIKRRREIAAKYNDAFASVKWLITPFSSDHQSHVYHQYALRIKKESGIKRDNLISYLIKKDIESGIYYPKVLYQFPHLSKFRYESKTKNAEEISSEIFSIPVHPSLTDENVEYIIDSILNYEN